MSHYKNINMRSHQTTSLLFEGMGSEVDDELSAAGNVSPSPLEEAATMVTEGRNKLLSRDSVHLLMIVSLAIGMLILIISFAGQRSSKSGVGHFYLPRP